MRDGNATNSSGNTLELTGITGRYTKVQAFFEPLVSDLSDGQNSEFTRGTLRYALANAKDNETIRFSKSISGEEIKLNSPLKIDNKEITIEGNGLILTPSEDWNNTESLLQISAPGKFVKIQRVHFKNGHAANGGAIMYSSHTHLIIFRGRYFKRARRRRSQPDYKGLYFLFKYRRK